MPPSFRDIFGFGSDERIVLSVCAVPREGQWRLMHATLLAVPEACASVSWGEWRREQVRDLGPPLGPLPASLSVRGDDWLMARAVVELEQADRWLRRLTHAAEAAGENATTVQFDAIAPVPALSATLRAPRAMFRALPGTDAPAGSLLAGLGRPAQALLWAGVPDGRFRVPRMVEVAGESTFLAGPDLVGIHVSPDRDADVPCGLLVGRAERRAWLGTSRGDGSFETFLVDLGWDPARIALSELELTHEELLDGELIASSRFRLEDLDTRKVEHRGSGTIRLPSIGRLVAHGVALHTVEGELLDRRGPYPLIERVEISLTADGEAFPPFVTGVTEPPPRLDQRTRRAAQVAEELERVERDGVQARMIADRRLALDRLTGLLESARGELLVLDRYFGQSGEDWRLLDDVPVPVRVLCGKLQQDHTPRIAPHVRARFRRNAGIHERVYLWEGGGWSVGGSPTTFGQGPIRFSSLRQAEREEWRRTFETEWKLPLYKDVERVRD